MKSLTITAMLIHLSIHTQTLLAVYRKVFNAGRNKVLTANFSVLLAEFQVRA